MPAGSSEAGAISGKVSSSAEATVTVTTSLCNAGWYSLSGVPWHAVSARLSVGVAPVVGWPSAVLVWECFHVLWLRCQPRSKRIKCFSSVSPQRETRTETCSAKLVQLPKVLYHPHSE